MFVFISHIWSGPVFSYKLRYIVGFGLVEMAISTNTKPAIYRNLYENTALYVIFDEALCILCLVFPQDIGKVPVFT